MVAPPAFQGTSRRPLQLMRLDQSLLQLVMSPLMSNSMGYLMPPSTPMSMVIVQRKTFCWIEMYERPETRMSKVATTDVWLGRCVVSAGITAWKSPQMRRPMELSLLAEMAPLEPADERMLSRFARRMAVMPPLVRSESVTMVTQLSCSTGPYSISTASVLPSGCLTSTLSLRATASNQ